MNQISLELENRTVVGKKLAKLRKDGYIPSVGYGGSSEPISTQSPTAETIKLTNKVGKHTPVNIIIDGKKKLAIIKEIDIDPVKQSLRHLAFHTINQTDKIVTEVSIRLIGVGENPAERAGLVVLQAIERIEVRAISSKLPEALELSLLGLETADDKLTLADIKLPEGVEFADHEQDLELVVANVYEPSALQAANEAAGGDAEEIDEVVVENKADETLESVVETKKD